jgi:SAM-dependent methyltransferase
MYTSFAAGAAFAPYDRRAAVYDAIVGRSIYHRTFWGTSPHAYARFGRAALAAAHDGHFAEVGCGSLLFTAPMYLAAHGRSIVLVDRSLQMLRRGVRRLDSARNVLPAGITVLHADAAALPVRAGSFTTILSLNVLHVPCDRRAIVAEWARTLVPGHGRLFVSALVRSGRWSDAWLAILHRAGELGPPVTLDELRETVAGRWAVVESMTVEGNMCFLVVRHAG